ncbi:hypothetical protein [Streptomyces longisporus]|uniref:Uncharacterized protein n=1 Tax=Streptomyces longisporus TaxID=1948 RepID=A0ABN3N3P7_STRLO
MPEPLTLAALGGAAIAEGIKFLYAQAGELLRRRREHADGEAEETATPAVISEPELLPRLDLTRIEGLEDELRLLRSDLHEYATGVDIVTDPPDSALIQRVDALRQVFECIYGTRLMFAGEARRAADVSGAMTAQDVAGYVAAVRASGSGTFRGVTKVGRVEKGGEAVGVEYQG